MNTHKYILLLILGFTLQSYTKAQEVVELKLPKSDKLVLKLMFRNGSISDPIGKEGLTSMTTSLISEGGTQEMTASQIKEFIFPMAASYYSTIDKEVSVFTFQFHKDHIEKFYPIIKGLITGPAFKEEDFSRVKKNQQNYVDQVIRASSDEEYSKLMLENQLFRGTNYQYPVDGNSKGVESISLEDVKQHYKRVFTRNNLMIGIAGNYSADFLARLKKDMSTLPEGQLEVNPPQPVQSQGINVEIVAKENTLGSAIFAGFPMNVTRASNDFAALMVANSYLGEHRKSYSLLYQKIRSDRSMNYGDYTYIEWYENGGRNMLPQPGYPRSSNYFSIWIRPVQIASGLKKQYAELENIKIGHAHFALRMAIRELENLVSKGMSQENFELTREFLRSYIKLYTQTPAKQLGFLMDSRFYGRTDYINEVDQLLAKLTLQDVNATIKKYWQSKNMYVSIVTDISEAQALAESLKSNTDSPMSYSNALKETLPKEILAEDDVVAKYPLNVTKVKVIKNEDTFK